MRSRYRIEAWVSDKGSAVWKPPTATASRAKPSHSVVARRLERGRSLEASTAATRQGGVYPTTSGKRDSGGAVPTRIS
jgi:hypothetical protein